MTSAQFLCRCFLFIYFVCISCTLVFSNKKSGATDTKLSPEEYERRRKIVNSYLSGREEITREWVEPYHHIYSHRRTNGIKKSSDSGENKIDEIEHKFTEEERQTRDLELSEYEMNVSETFKDYFKNISNHSSDLLPEESDLVKLVPSIEEVENSQDVESNQNIESLVINMEVKDAKSYSSQPIESEKLLDELLNVEKDPAPKDEIIQIVINGKKVKLKRTDYLQLFKAQNILNQLRDLKETQTDDVTANQNAKPVLNHGEDESIKNVSPEGDKILNYSPNLGKIPAFDETIIGNKFPDDDLLFKRHEIVNSYLSKFDSTDDWVEPYIHNSQFKRGKDSSFHAHHLSQISDTGIKEEKIKNYGQFCDKSHHETSSSDRFYINRWLKMLINKFHDAKYESVTFYLDAESIDKLRKLSENFDIVSVDEFFCGFISNSTVNYRLSWFSNFHPYTIAILLITVLVFFICIKCRPFYSCLFLFLVLCIGLQAYKRYEISIAKKQAIASSIPPSYCESFVTEQSGLLGIIKDVFRKSFYDEDCKKYFEAVMVNPVYDTNPIFVIMDILYEIVLQGFRSFAESLNYFIKELLYGTSLIHKFFIIISLIFFLIFCCYIITLWFNYKIRFPYFFATIEPTFTPVGSRVEDLGISRDCSSKISSLLGKKNQTDLSKDGTELGEMKANQLGNASKTLSAKPNVCTNMHKYLSRTACQHLDICSDDIAVLSERQNTCFQSSIKSREQCICDSLNFHSEKKNEPCFHGNINNKSASGTSIEINCNKVDIISVESKKHSSSNSEFPIKSPKICSCLSHQENLLGENLSNRSFCSNVASKTSSSSDDSTMCSENCEQTASCEELK